MADSKFHFQEIPRATGPKRRRLNPRTSLACTSCRQKKTKCSGQFPACETCQEKGLTCEYKGGPPPAVLSPFPTHDQLSTQESLRASLPTDDLRRRAVSYFQENYAQTFLCFISPQDLTSDYIGQNLPLPLLFAILTLVSKFIPVFSSQASDEFAQITQQSLRGIYDEPSLPTIQSLLILTIYEFGKGAEHSGWLRLGHAIRLAQLLRLHKLDSDPPSFHVVTFANETLDERELEARRRTFWCCFCLDQLLANGRDRIAVLSPEQISTRLPQSDGDFIYSRHSNAPRLPSLSTDISPGPSRLEAMTLFGHTIRVINILGDILAWHGNGGRHVDHRCPWLPDMPFTVLDNRLRKWSHCLPKHFVYTRENMTLVTAAGEGRLWCLMWLFYYQAVASLHKEYLPFTSAREYDPKNGPWDGPTIISDPNQSKPEDWWLWSAEEMVLSASIITDLYSFMNTKGLSLLAYPFPGFCLLTAASILIQCTIFDWPSMWARIVDARASLKVTLELCSSLGEHWELANHWIWQLSLYYKLNLMNKRSWSNSEKFDLSSIDMLDVKNEIMNYVRDIRRADPRSSTISAPPRNLKFGFEPWIAILENSTAQSSNSGLPAASRSATLPSAPELGPDDESSSEAVTRVVVERGGLPREHAPISTSPEFNIENGAMLDSAWWNIWELGDWDPSLFV